MRRSVALLMGILALSVSVHSTLAQTTAPSVSPHQTISYQGMLRAADGKLVTDGDYQIIVRLYSDEAGTQEVWHDTYLAHVAGGVFGLLLGSGTQPLPAPSDLDKGLWVGVQIGATNELRPLTPMTATPYALNVPDKSITEKKIDADYVRSISINGQKAVGRAADLNIITGDGIDATFDPATNAIMMKGNGLGSGAQNGAFTQGSGDFLPNTNHVGGLGNSTKWWNSLWADTIHTAMPAGVVHSPGSGGALYTTTVALNSEVSNVLAGANGGTGQSSYSKGDILYAGAAGSTLSKRSIGLTGQVLQVSSNGVPEWTSIIAPPANNSGSLGAPDKRFADLYLGPHSLNISDGSIETDLSIQQPTDLTGTTSSALVVSVDSTPQMAVTSDGVSVAGDLSTQGNLAATGDITSSTLTTDGTVTTGGDVNIGGNLVPTDNTTSIGTPDSRVADLYLGPHSLNISDGSIETDLSIQQPTDLTGTTSSALVVSVDSTPQMAVTSDGVAVAGDLTAQGSLSTTGSISTTSDLSTAGALTIGTDAVILRANPTMNEDVQYFLPSARPSGTNIYLKAGTGSGSPTDPYVMSWGALNATDIANGSIANAKLTNSTIGITSTGSTMTVSGSPIALGSSGNLDLNLAHGNTWTGNQLLPATATQGNNLVASINAGSTAITQVTTETSRAQSAEATLQSNLNAEASTRSTADNTLQSNITSEASARTSADNTLQANINSEASTRASAISTEVSARTSADNTLQANINSEATTRASADNTLQSNIDAEAATRASAITSEAAARTSADITLQANINSEATTRASADNTLQSNIDAESAARISADNTLQSNINAKVSAVTASSPLASSGGTTPNISLTGIVPVANGGTGSSQDSGNTVFAGPTTPGSYAAPSFRRLVAADLPAGSLSYINNSTSQQASANFNISGSGTVGTTFTAGGTINTNQNYKINNATVLSTPDLYSTWVGQNVNAGGTDQYSTLIGTYAGASSAGSSSYYNTDIGMYAGYSANGTGITAVGTYAGYYSIGNYNASLGYLAGYYNQNGGGYNVNIGMYAGYYNLTGGSGNVNIGYEAGYYYGSNNGTFLGYLAQPTASGLINVTAIGANATVSQSNSIVLGNGANVGIGISAPSQKLDVVGNVKFSGQLMPAGNAGTSVGVLHGGAAPAWGPVNLATDVDGTVLPVANGGTGASTASSARSNLGLGTAATNNTGDFIANGTSQQASANFNIAGNGTVGNLMTVGTQAGDPASPSADTRLRLKGTNGNFNTWDYGVVSNGDLGYVESYYDNFGYYLDDDNNNGGGVSFTINHGASHTGSPVNMMTLSGAGNLTVSGALNGTALNVSSGNISMPFNKSIGSANNSDQFTYDGKTIGHYSMGFYNDSWNSSPTGWLSAYAGFKLFSAGSLMAQINGDFAKFWGVLQANGGLDMLNNTIANVSHINNGAGGTIAIDGNVDFNNHNLSNLGYVSLNSTSTLSAVSGTVNFGSDIDARNHSIFNVTDPVSAQDAATKNYVDNAASTTNFIRNGSNQQSSANFNISGNGTIGGQLTASTAGIGTNSPAAPLEVKSQTPGSLLRISSPNGNGDIEMNSSYRPTIYPYGPNVPANGLDFQIRSAGNGILGLNFDDGADVIIGRSTNRGGSNVGIGPSWDINNLPVARLDVDGNARITRNMGTVSNGTYYGLHSSISTSTGNVVNIIGVYGASSGTDDLSVGVQGQGTGTGGGTTIGGDFSAHNVSSQGTAIAVRADATGATNNIAVEATNGDVYVTDHNKGIILKDANNNCWRVTVNTSGQLVTTALSTCPN